MENIEGEPDPFDIVFEVGNGKPTKKILFDKPTIGEVNAIKDELSSFHEAITTESEPRVTLEDGFKALKVAHMVLEKIDENSKVQL